MWLRPSFKINFLFLLPFSKLDGLSVAQIGAGHHAFSSIAYFLKKYTKSSFLFVIDKDISTAKSFSFAYNCTQYSSEVSDYIDHEKLPQIVYVASSHSTHFEYEIFLKLGVDLFIEKPLVTSFSQLASLDFLVQKSQSKIFAGFNRPFSKAIKILLNYMKPDFPFTISLTVVGHLIPEDHWYRAKDEGSRIISNLSHWIDLVLFFIFRKDLLVSSLDINISTSSHDKFCDNINLSMISNQGDQISICFTSRSDPFEGVYESILFDQTDLLVKIDDFRYMHIWNKTNYRNFKFFPKDNGHKDCVLQPFSVHNERSWQELKTSTHLMLFIETMLLENNHSSCFKFS